MRLLRPIKLGFFYDVRAELFGKKELLEAMLIGGRMRARRSGRSGMGILPVELGNFLYFFRINIVRY